MRLKSFLLLFLFSTIATQAQTLKLEDIMKGDGFIGYQPENSRWSLDGQIIYFDWNPKKEWGSSTYYWKKGMKTPELVTGNEINLSQQTYIPNSDKSIFYYVDNGALYSYNVKSAKTVTLFQQSVPISNLQVGSEKGIVFFEQNNNIFQFNTNEASVMQLTNFKKGKEKDKPVEDNFLDKQQKELFQYIRDQEAKKKWYEAKAKLVKADFPKAVYSDKADFLNLTVNPKGTSVAFTLFEASENKSEIMEDFITSDGYNRSREVKTKVSTSNFFKTKFGIYNTLKDTAYFVDFSKLSHSKDKPKYYELYPELNKKEATERAVCVNQVVFSTDGKYAVADIRSQDNKDRWLISLNQEEGSFTELEHQHDEAWIGGPEIPAYSFEVGTLGFLADNQTIYFQSEATGYSHLYTYNLISKSKKQLTFGNWEVHKVVLSNDKKAFYLTTNTTHPGNREFYKLSVSGGKMEPILVKEGYSEVKLSPDEKSLLVRYSYKNKPWELYVADNKANTTVTQITQSQSEEFKKYNWRAPEVITFKAQDGANVNARIYVPEAKVKNGAAVIFVHGAGYLQNAHNYWSGYMREYMFHNMLTDLGYTVLDVDYRASEGYGRDHRIGIYRFMGGKDLSDQVDGKNVLVNKYGINPNKVGIYGGSYGGFITLMALMTAPNDFKVGCAIRSVTDWAHYNHEYTGNILNFPETDPDAFTKSSPIYYADKLQGHLLMLHGMVDDNVEYKDIVRISQRFIEFGKKSWSLASYPVEPHGFKETYSWVDEYGRILEHFNTYLLDK
ncbi:prolyl oligopeptidase family serine peptidase [Flavobacterium sp.]|uniref:S9 family peptidase n=1 Tax=Flavobacterium sp. TaxID=239 RepID=UPI002489E6EC|nr:prolyl oligopeptidase family serine peptidase [Flavobacterium sp.]MDI1317089.1 prolyl oligopeptidase family serine peptidase [Flavobacterium sp.]